MSRSLLLAVLFLFGAGVAHAEKKVDWSQYLEPPGSRPAPRATPTVAEPEAKPRAKKAKVVKQRSAKAATKAKRKPARRR